jgi:hypothetical protein
MIFRSKNDAMVVVLIFIIISAYCVIYYEEKRKICHLLHTFIGDYGFQWHDYRALNWSVKMAILSNIDVGNAPSFSSPFDIFHCTIRCFILCENIFL